MIIFWSLLYFPSTSKPAQPWHHWDSRRAKTKFWNCSRSLTADTQLHSLQLLSSCGPDVCHGLSFLIHILQLPHRHKPPPFVQARITLPSQEYKNQLSLTPRDLEGHRRPSALHTSNISSSVSAPAEPKTAGTFLPNSHFHKAASSGQKCSFDYMLTQFLTQTSLVSILLAVKPSPCFVTQLSTAWD